MKNLLTFVFDAGIVVWRVQSDRLNATPLIEITSTARCGEPHRHRQSFLFSRGRSTPRLIDSIDPSRSGIGMDFVFINVKVPQDALQLAKEPEIRSHLARRQWRRHAENRSATIAKRKREEAVPICGDLDCVTLQKRVNVQSTVSDGGPGAGGTTIMSFSIPPPLGGLRVDPFRSYPIAWRPFVPRLVDHCK